MARIEPRPEKRQPRAPVRTCLVCGRKRGRRELIRLALEPGETGRVVQDPKQTMQGRGGYSCPECIQGLRLNKRVQKAFRGEARELSLDRI